MRIIRPIDLSPELFKKLSLLTIPKNAKLIKNAIVDTM